ncbi:MAG: CoB--CoM heterodisulfide reductase iron-sulfur subunit B family protein [Anaerolineae bacterium]|nr:CoB--CoM heterodisulfide reductase iron-sulfur subunit B family protein [Anaerolineae bacterium]
MRFALYLGCTVPVRAMNYEVAARRTADHLGIELVDLDGFACCGYPAKPLSWDAALLMAANNLALAEEHGLDVCTLCSACTSTLVEANKHLQEDSALRARINDQLSENTGRRYAGTVTVRHYARILYEEVGPERLRQESSVDLSGFGFAVHYGCHFLKPAHIYDGFDDPENPHTLGDLVAATGARLIPYEEEDACCGGGILAVDPDTALGIAKGKLDHVHITDADGMIVICPFCDIMYEINQRSIERQFDVSYRLPVLYYPQLLGLALGYSADEMQLRLNRVKSRELIQAFTGRARCPGAASNG